MANLDFFFPKTLRIVLEESTKLQRTQFQKLHPSLKQQNLDKSLSHGYKVCKARLLSEKDKWILAIVAVAHFPCHTTLDPWLTVEQQFTCVQVGMVSQSCVFDARAVPVLDGAREVNRSKQSSGEERLKHNPTLPHHVPCPRLMIHFHQYSSREFLFHFRTLECDDAEIKMKGDTTSMKVLHVVDSSSRYLGATDVDHKGGSSGVAAKWRAEWLESTGDARMKVQSDAEPAMEHLLQAVKCFCSADVIEPEGTAPCKTTCARGRS